MAACVAMCTVLQADWCLCPREWRFPPREEALCQGSRWAGAAAAGRPCMIIMWAYSLQQCQNSHLAFILSVVRAVYNPAAHGTVQGQAVGCAQPSPRWEAAGSSRAEGKGNICFCLEHPVRGAKLSPCFSLSPVQAELHQVDSCLHQ